MAKPTVLPKWADVLAVDGTTGVANRIEPSSGKKDTGWNFNEKPPRQFDNWLHFITFKWLEFFDGVIDQDVRSGSNPTFGTITGTILNLSGDISADNIVAAGDVTGTDLNAVGDLNGTDVNVTDVNATGTVDGNLVTGVASVSSPLIAASANLNLGGQTVLESHYQYNREARIVSAAADKFEIKKDGNGGFHVVDMTLTNPASAGILRHPWFEFSLVKRSNLNKVSINVEAKAVRLTVGSAFYVYITRPDGSTFSMLKRGSTDFATADTFQVFPTELLDFSAWTNGELLHVYFASSCPNFSDASATEGMIVKNVTIKIIA